MRNAHNGARLSLREGHAMSQKNLRHSPIGNRAREPVEAPDKLTRRKLLVRKLALVFSLFVLFQTAGGGQIPINTTIRGTDPLGRSTPYGTVVGFIEAAKHDDFDRAAQYLGEKSNAPNTSEVARRLFLALDRNLTADLDSLSRDPNGNSPDQLNPNRYRVGTIAAKSGSLVISLDRVQQENGQSIWLFSPETTMRISEASVELQPLWIERYLPEPLVSTKVLANFCLALDCYSLGHRPRTVAVLAPRRSLPLDLA
jgi:hypothetical protein